MAPLPQRPVHHFARRLTWFARPLPDFLIIGAMKAGTTSLFRYICQHPDVLPPVKKEPLFFTNQWRRGVSWYRSQFPSKPRLGDKKTGEASPYYLVHPDAPARAAHVVPEARLIAVLRDPVERAWSHYQYVEGGSPAVFEQALDDEERRIAEHGLASARTRRRSHLIRGHYAQQLRHWLQYYPREALHVVIFEEMNQDPGAAVADAYRHIGLRPWRPTQFPRHNPTRQKRRLPEPLRRRLEAYFEPHNNDLAALLGRPLPWSQGVAKNAKTSL